MRIVALVQARCGSQRLPGKVLRPLAGRPMIAHLLERLGACREIDGLVLATSDTPADDALATWAANSGYGLFRGPHDDVATRLLMAARASAADAFVRLNGDSPLLDPALVDRVCALFRAQRPELATNVLVRSFPKGQSVEVLDTARFAELLPHLDAPEREHVTPRFYARWHDFRISSLESGRDDWGQVQLSVDTAEDFAAVASLLAHLPEGPAGWSLATIMAARADLAAAVSAARPAIVENVRA